MEWQRGAGSASAAATSGDSHADFEKPMDAANQLWTRVAGVAKGRGLSVGNFKQQPEALNGELEVLNAELAKPEERTGLTPEKAK